MRAVLLVSHGSYSSKVKEEVGKLSETLKLMTGIEIFEYAFLEVEMPDIAAGLETCIQKGSTEILVLLNFLNSGRHVNNDIPSIVREIQDKHPHITIKLSQPIGQHPKIKELFVDLIRLT
ncbi:MAG: CbiX/SirB N-terminal domain-containing protein [Candidatus Omnitrophota bacterium]